MEELIVEQYYMLYQYIIQHNEKTQKEEENHDNIQCDSTHDYYIQTE